MSTRSKKMLAATVCAMSLALAAPPMAAADPGTGREIGGGTQAPLQPRPSPSIINTLKNLLRQKKPVVDLPPVEIPRAKVPTSIVPPRIKQAQDETISVLKKMAKDAIKDAVKDAACDALDSNHDYDADFDSWAGLIVDRLPQWVVDRAAGSQFVMDVVVDGAIEVATPLSGLTSHWTGPIYVAAC